MMLTAIILINLMGYQNTIAHHIIFENIGQLASAVTYLHAKVTVNFTTIEDQYLIYSGMLIELFRINGEANLDKIVKRQFAGNLSNTNEASIFKEM